MTTPITVIVGAGPGLGAALAKRFGQAGHQLALLTRSEASRADALAVAKQVGTQATGFACDVGDAASVQTAFAAIREQLGQPSTLIYNAGLMVRAKFMELTPEQFVSAWQTNCLGGFLTAQQVLPDMLANGAGTILMTGATASLRSGADFAGFATGKFGLRAIAQSMAREFGSQGIHVAHVNLDGQIATPKNLQRLADRDPSTLLDPNDIAEVYWQLHQQPRSTWTQELDLRPHCESF